MTKPNAKESVATFVQELVRRHGATVTQARKNAIQVTFPKAPSFSGEREFVIAFERKSLSYYPDAKLAIPGSPFYLALLDAARAEGRATRVYTPIVEPLPELFGGRWIHTVNPGFDLNAAQTTNDPHVIFNFALSFQSVVASDDLISIAYDLRREAFRHSGITDALHSVWSEALSESPGDWPEMPAPNPNDLVEEALKELERRTRRKVARARRNTQQYLNQEIQNVEDYYRQLIAEEKEFLNRVSRTSPKEADERKKRIHRYQLDWKRRIAEESRHHQCRVHIRLVSASIVYMPRTAFYSNDDETTPACYFNHFLGTLDGFICAETGVEIGPWEQTQSGDWVSLSRRDDDEHEADDVETVSTTTASPDVYVTNSEEVDR